MSEQKAASFAKHDTEGRITEESVARMRARIGVEIPKHAWQVWNTACTVDSFRHFAYGFGDDNPLFVDPEYGAKTRWRSTIAPPAYLYSTGITEKKDLTEEERRKGGGALRGVHAFWSGDEIQYFRPVFPGDRMTEQRYVCDVQLKKSAFGGTSVVTRDRTVYTSSRGEIACIWDKLFVRAERQAGATRGKYAEITRAQYTEDDLRKIEADYDKEVRRGDVPRYWEDVVEGEEIPHVVHGPLIISDELAWMAGNGRWEIFPHKIGLQLRRRHPAFYSLNDWGVPEAVMRCHWEDNFARKIGNPMAYDNGIMRSSWMMHIATNWMGDDGWLCKVNDRIRQFNYFGDTTWVKGKIARKYQQDGDCLADLDIHCVDQRGRITATSLATVLLPSKTGGPVQLPRPPRGYEGRRPGSPPVVIAPGA